MYTDDCRHYLKTWLQHFGETMDDVETVRTAARHVATCASCQNYLRRMAQAVTESVEDPLRCDECQAQLPEYIHAKATGTASDRYDAVRRHLALCPYCAGIYAQVYDLVQDSQADAIPPADTYPEFDLFVVSETAWAADEIQDALERGRQWVRDAAGALYVLFGPGLQARPTSAWATKSAQPGTVLHQVTAGVDETEGWEVEVLAFAEDDETCRIEVALYRPGAPDADLAQVPIILRYDDVARARRTDAGGVAEFDRVPSTSLENVVIRVAPGID